MLLFALCLLTVFRILPYGIMTVVVLAVIAVVEFSILKELDFGLLVTFVCFFIVSGNLGRIDAVHTVLQSLLERSTCLTAVLTSQVISNVPAAILLSGFTTDYPMLLRGVNIGGLGTLIASLASLISYKQYALTPQSEKGKYMLVFTGWNVVFLVILWIVAAVFY